MYQKPNAGRRLLDVRGQGLWKRSIRLHPISITHQRDHVKQSGARAGGGSGRGLDVVKSSLVVLGFIRSLVALGAQILAGFSGKTQAHLFLFVNDFQSSGQFKLPS